MSQFQYQPLDPSKNEFRLLYPVGQAQHAWPIIAHRWHNVVVGPDLTMEFELRAVSLDNKPNYTALSYVWGDASAVASKKIVVNNFAFPITKNLEIALQHLQYHDIQPAVWIDAICIDQSNYDEKDDQVPRMSRIYSNARNVLIWLGPGTKDNRYIHMILYEWVLLSGNSTSTFADHYQLSSDVHSDGPCEPLKAFVTAIETVRDFTHEVLPDLDTIAHWWQHSVLASGWWSRTWTIQEFVLAKECQFLIGPYWIGQDELSLISILFDCIRLVSSSTLSGEVGRSLDVEGNVRLSNGTTLRAGRGTVAHDVKYNLAQWKSPKFFDILMMVYCSPKHQISCSNARDRVFALRSLAEDDYKSLGIQTHYRKEPWEVYMDVAHRTIASGQLDILSLCHEQNYLRLANYSQFKDPHRTQNILPSWAVDWSQELTEPHVWFNNSRNSLFSASGETIASVSFRKHKMLEEQQSSCSITLTGFLVDVIYQVGRTECVTLPRDVGIDMLSSLSEEIEAMCKISQGFGHDIYTPAQCREAVWRVPIWDHERVDINAWRRATSLSKSRYDTALHLVRSNEQYRKLDEIPPKESKHGALRNFWNGILYRRCWVKIHYHMAKYFSWSGNLAFRTKYWLGAILLIIFRCPWVHSIQEGLLGKTADFLAYYLSTMTDGYRSRLILTHRGYIGLAPSTIKPGDAVYIFFGSRVPHVLRRRDAGQPGYTLVGDAFIYGAMDGELVSSDREQVDVEIF
ncbi:heterokaryon incompatibility protein-domain-containing protein [Paraphoma chrysanthemicola]|uniref:Heterokaryon incompatibility protein-domain-containing protein n=1 Tax=Paraphoma chrysanthemicola TaxID=798071 RepID=A0A8K0RFT7_9PLEO|nr:heterokaryon incompatibility protein-domain-containing protein [Paraphoma chrysanthemicola]